MNPVSAIVRQPVTVAVGVIMILIVGFVVLTRLPVSLTPQVESTVITVSTFWEGASPEEIEQNVVDPQEERLFGLSDLTLMTSKSNQNAGTISLHFAPSIDKNAALREVAQKLGEVPEYPDGVDEPVVTEGSDEDRDYIAWIVLGTTDPNFDVRVLRDFTERRIEPYLESVRGVSEINVLGGREREVQVRLDPVALAQHGVTPSAFVQAIRETNLNLSAGELHDGKRDVRLRTIGQYPSVEDVGATVIVHSAGGGVVRVRDVAEVVSTYKEPSGFVRASGIPVIAINAEREPGSNVMEVMGGLKAALADLNAPGGTLDSESKRLGLSAPLTLTQVYDQTTYIEDALALVRSNIWIGGALATIVLILFLRSIRSVGIIALAIPISVVGAIVAMFALGRSINVVSLAGMAFAVGMVVDNAIVVLENIYRHLELGKSPMEAARAGAGEVWGAVLASTLTTVAVFVPILLIEEQSGQLLRDLALAICSSVILSLVVSVTVIPTASARLLRRRKAKATPTAQPGERTGSSRIARIFHAFLGSIMLRLVAIVGLTVVAVGGTSWLMPAADYLPSGNRNLIFGLIIPPPGYNVDQFERIAERVESTIEPYWEAGKLVDDPDAYAAAKTTLPAIPVGPGATVTPPPIENYFIVNFEDVLFHGAVASEGDRVADVLPLFMHATRPEVVPDSFAFPFQMSLFQLGGTTGSAIKLQLSGGDLNEITESAMALFMQLMGVFGPGAVQPDPGNFNLRTPEIQVRPDLVRLSELGLSVRDLGVLVQACGDGAIVDEYHEAGESIDLKVVAASSVDRQNISGLGDLPLATPAGYTVPIQSVAELRWTGAPPEIARVGRQRSVSFQITPDKEMPLETAVETIDTILADARASGMLPASITTSVVGTADNLKQITRELIGDGTFSGTLSSSLVLALIVVYLLMCVLFQSFGRPLVIMFSVPLATLGGVLALYAVHEWSLSDPYMPTQNLDVMTMLGFILLIGIVVNNAILIVHQAGNFLRDPSDLGVPAGTVITPRRAIAEAVASRVRPIFMSTLTSVGGMLPLVLMPGSGSELYRGLGSVVVGGLLVSTVFTLVLVPSLLSFFMRSTPPTEATSSSPAPAARLA